MLHVTTEHPTLGPDVPLEGFLTWLSVLEPTGRNQRNGHRCLAFSRRWCHKVSPAPALVPCPPCSDVLNAQSIGVAGAQDGPHTWQTGTTMGLHPGRTWLVGRMFCPS